MSFSPQSERSNEAGGRDAAVATALYAALGSLDVQLESELERYRSIRDRADVSDRSAADRPVEIPEATIAEAAPGSIALAPSATEEDGEGGDLASAERAGATGENASPFDLALGETDDDLELGGIASDVDDSLADADGAAAAADEKPATASTPPDGYLASSEALLASERGRRRAKRSVSPLSVGAVVLLLLASATVGYILVNPESLDRLGWRAWFGRDVEADTDATEPTADAAPDAAELPTSPNLAAEEFVEIDIDTLSALESPTTPTPAPAPEASPAPEAAPDPANSLDSLANALAPETNPSPNTSPAPSPSPAPNSAPPLPQATDDPSYTGFYFVVVNEGNDTALNRVRSSNPDAYFEEIVGAQRIQVGAFDDFAVASEVAARLTAQGLPAQVYRP